MRERDNDRDSEKEETLDALVVPGSNSASLLISFSFCLTHTKHTPVNVPVGVVMDQDVECVGVAVCFLDEAVNSCLSALVHLDHITLSIPLRHTLLV